MTKTKWIAGAPLAAALALGTPGAAWAGKYCIDPVESGTSSGASQEEALLAATKWWSTRAGARGRGYESWDNADDRAMECSKEAATFRCKVSGRPCLPDGVLPQNHPQDGHGTR